MSFRWREITAEEVDQPHVRSEHVGTTRLWVLQSQGQDGQWTDVPFEALPDPTPLPGESYTAEDAKRIADAMNAALPLPELPP